MKLDTLLYLLYYELLVLPIDTNVHTYGVVYKGSLNSHNVFSEIRKQPILLRKWFTATLNVLKHGR